MEGARRIDRELEILLVRLVGRRGLVRRRDAWTFFRGIWLDCSYRNCLDDRTKRSASHDFLWLSCLWSGWRICGRCLWTDGRAMLWPNLSDFVCFDDSVCSSRFAGFDSPQRNCCVSPDCADLDLRRGPTARLGNVACPQPGLG